MVTLRRLPVDEFPRLAQVSDGIVPNPEITVALVAEDGEQIVGRMFLMSPAHIEGTWVHESARRGTVGFRLLKRMEQEAANSGIMNILAYSMDPKVSDYLSRMGYKRTEAVVFQKELPCR